MTKPSFDKAFLISILLLVILRVATYTMTQFIILNNGIEVNSFADVNPTFLAWTTLLYLVPMVAIAFFKRPDIRAIGYSLVIAVLVGDLVWDSLQLAGVSLGSSLVVDWAIVASIPTFAGIWQMEKMRRNFRGHGHLSK